MSRWDPLPQRFGFGAARVPLCPPSVPRNRECVPLLAGLKAIRSERRSGDTLRTCLRASPPLIAGVFITLLLASLTQPNAETSIVPFAEITPGVEEPAIELAEIPTPVVPEPEPAEVPEPPAPVPVVAQAPPKAPEPPRAEPPAQRPEPTLPALALALAQPAPAPTRTRPREAPRAAPANRPDLALHRLSEAPAPEAVRNARRAPRFAQARVSQPRPQLAAPSPGPAALAPADPTPSRRSRSAPRVRPTSRPSAPALAAPRSQLPSGNDTPAPARRSNRSVANTRTSIRSPKPNLTGPSAPQARSGTRPPRGSGSKPVRVAAPAAPGNSRTGGSAESITGVPLASLAACVSDAREHTLKQRILAAVRKRDSCQSAVGRYHFVETKNLNAFLMRIERASGRRVGDRCAELTYALDCLSR